MAERERGLSDEMIAWATSTLDDVRHKVVEEAWFERENVTGDIAQDRGERQKLAALWGIDVDKAAEPEAERETVEPERDIEEELER